MDTALLLFKTVLFRPYVFIFLAVYLAAAAMKLGKRKAVLFTLTGWAAAFAAESSSIRNGIPFGMYCYLPSTEGRELWLYGVPFMDSLSFTFLAYASWCTARVILSPSEGGWASFRLVEPDARRFSSGKLLLGASLMTMLDVVIDPLALRGDRWFLGKIYCYPEPGPYFGVTIENFMGWFIVGIAVLCIWRAIDNKTVKGRHDGRPMLDLLGPALFYAVLLFNLGMTFFIGEYALGAAGALLFAPVTALVFMKLKGQTSGARPGKA